jgi:hypothetical protein
MVYVPPFKQRRAMRDFALGLNSRPQVKLDIAHIRLTPFSVREELDLGRRLLGASDRMEFEAVLEEAAARGAARWRQRRIENTSQASIVPKPDELILAERAGAVVKKIKPAIVSGMAAAGTTADRWGGEKLLDFLWKAIGNEISPIIQKYPLLQARDIARYIGDAAREAAALPLQIPAGISAEVGHRKARAKRAQAKPATFPQFKILPIPGKVHHRFYDYRQFPFGPDNGYNDPEPMASDILSPASIANWYPGRGFWRRGGNQMIIIHCGERNKPESRR